MDFDKLNSFDSIYSYPKKMKNGKYLKKFTEKN